MKILLVGNLGMLGQDLQPVLDGHAEVVTGVDRDQLDITDIEACRSGVSGHDVVVNVAAWTAVDLAEEKEGAAFTINATGAANLARAAAEHSAGMVHISTDYVFDGMATSAYAEDAPMAPRSAYGRTKAAGEWAVRSYCPQSWVVRTAWLYGAHGPNFVKTMAKLAQERDTLSVVDDQLGQPTWTMDLAHAIGRLLVHQAPPGIYHGTSSGATTWFGFTQRIFELLGHDPARVLPTTTAEFPRPAPRPANSVLGHEAWQRAGLPSLPHWRDSLDHAFESVTGAAV